MPQYRIYLLDDLGMRFHSRGVEATDHTAALAVGWDLLETHNAGGARQLAYGIEVWLGHELVRNSWTRWGSAG